MHAAGVNMIVNEYVSHMSAKFEQDYLDQYSNMYCSLTE